MHSVCQHFPIEYLCSSRPPRGMSGWGTEAPSGQAAQPVSGRAGSSVRRLAARGCATSCHRGVSSPPRGPDLGGRPSGQLLSGSGQRESHAGLPRGLHAPCASGSSRKRGARRPTWAPGSGPGKAPPQWIVAGVAGGQKWQEMRDPAKGFPWTAFMEGQLQCTGRMSGIKLGLPD